MTERNASPRLKTAPRDGTTKSAELIVTTAAELFQHLSPMIEKLIAEKVDCTLKAREEQDRITLDQMLREAEFADIVVPVDFEHGDTVPFSVNGWRNEIMASQKAIARHQQFIDTVEEAIEQAWIKFAEDADAGVEEG